VGVGCAEHVTDLPPSAFAFVLRRSTTFFAAGAGWAVTAKRDSDNCDRLFAIYGIACLARRRFPMTDSCLTCLAIRRDASATGLAHGVVTKTYSVIHLTVTEASRRYSPAAS
jgi:hypothetical protein